MQASLLLLSSPRIIINSPLRWLVMLVMRELDNNNKAQLEKNIKIKN